MLQHEQHILPVDLLFDDEQNAVAIVDDRITNERWMTNLHFRDIAEANRRAIAKLDDKEFKNNFDGSRTYLRVL
jgi:hypothetical protein